VTASKLSVSLTEKDAHQGGRPSLHFTPKLMREQVVQGS